ncbi:hypothetical protein HMPREF0083_01880 [Aneurinibacillus aneurinilyticus ATCC 12856]|uniref:Uncharacterized protein n=1 Tax=Aneurinibacillus aneurinilyticus ATCC 12856 TaxID=649747 RepID=U1X650_ANEAE|nr:hypothetical protein HMPREF0083_01880 [Aneurinibacillus aneurinilyticus ATCC 12856]
MQSAYVIFYGIRSDRDKQQSTIDRRYSSDARLLTEWGAFTGTST